MPKFRALSLALALAILPAGIAQSPAAVAPTPNDHLKWTGWTADLFKKAKAENKMLYFLFVT